MKNILSNIFPHRENEIPVPGVPPSPFAGALLDDEADEKFKPDLEVIEDKDTDGRIQEAVKREIQSAAELSVKRLQVLQHGRCPQC